MIMRSSWMTGYMVIGTVLSCLSGCAKSDAMQGNSLFERYVTTFQPSPPDGIVVPELQPLPDEVYASAIVMAKNDRPRFEEMVCLYLARYDIYYLRHCHQRYSLVAPDEVQLVNAKSTHNDKFFMLNAFFDFSGTKVEQDGAPSNLVIFYCRAKAKQSQVIADILREEADAERECEKVWK